jgi:hypothetical protein
MNNNFHIGWCPFCNQGWVDVVKDPLHNRLFLFCNECETTWDNPVDFKLDKPINIEHLTKIIDPSFSEVQQLGWDKWLITLDDMRG